MTNYKIAEIDTTPQLDPYHRNTGGETRTCFWIDPRSKKIGISQEYDTNSCSMDEWNGLVISRYLSVRPAEDETRLELTDNDLVSRVIDGWDSDWNGNNIVGNLNDDAQTALEELIDNLESLPENPIVIWGCEEWYGNCSAGELGLTSETTNEEIKKLAEEYESDAKNDNVILADDLEDYLTERRNQLREE